MTSGRLNGFGMVLPGMPRTRATSSNVVKMKAGSEVYRLRVGDWRILFSLEEGGRVMLVQRVLNRRDAYR